MVTGKWYSLLTFPLTWWIFGVNLFHDASHHSLSLNWYLNKLGMDVAFIFNSPYVWLHQHVIGHHSFPNVLGKDPDLYHAPKFIRHSEDVAHKKLHSYQTLSFIGTWIVGVPLGLLGYGVTQVMTRPVYNRVVPFVNNKYLNKD